MIPIFLLVLVFEARIFRDLVFTANFLARLAGFILLLLILTGEVACLVVLKTPDAADSTVYFWLVIAALFWQFTLFILFTFPRPSTRPPGRSERPSSGRREGQRKG